MNLEHVERLLPFLVLVFILDLKHVVLEGNKHFGVRVPGAQRSGSVQYALCNGLVFK